MERLSYTSPPIAFSSGSTDYNCAKARLHFRSAATRRICDYRRCRSPQTHHTVVCPWLHQRCPDCGCRGHGALDICDETDSALMGCYRADFEEVASTGIYTKDRFDDLPWGWYPMPPSAPRRVRFLSYRELSEDNVVDALKQVTCGAASIAACSSLLLRLFTGQDVLRRACFRRPDVRRGFDFRTVGQVSTNPICLGLSSGSDHKSH